MNRKFCIATISWARNTEEEAVLKASLEELATLTLPVFITDGGSIPSFLQFVKTLPNFIVLQASEKGVFAQSRTSVMAAHAAGQPYIIYTEPDKQTFFKEGLPELIKTVDVDNTTGVLLASRSEKGLASFPPFQQMTEATINNCCAEVIGQQIDYTYGPFIFNAALAPYLSKINQDIGWGWRPFVFSMAHRLGLSVQALIDDFMCPPLQREDDTKERIYRMKQLEQNIRGIILSTEVAL